MNRIWLIGAGVLLGAVVVASIVLELFDEPTEFPDNSPERAVQLYLEASNEGNYQRVHKTFIRSLRDSCSQQDLLRTSTYEREPLRDSRVTLERTDITDDSVLLSARVTRAGSNDFFAISEYSFKRVFTLKQEDGEWRFSEFPWPFENCNGP